MTRAALLACALMFPAAARADQAGTCADAAESAQTLRDRGELREARRRLAVCVQESCPAPVRRDCARWLEDVDALQPTIVLHARDVRGHDVAGATAAMDGEPLASTLDGSSLRVDPGRHVITLVARSGARTRIEVVLVSGEKVRVLDVRFAVSLRADGSAEPNTSPPPAEALSPPAPSPPSPSRAGDLRWLGWSLAGLSVISLALGAGFEISGVSDWRAMHDGCAETGSCRASDVESARVRLWYAAPILFGVGAITGAFAAWTLLSSRGPRQVAAHGSPSPPW